MSKGQRKTPDVIEKKYYTIGEVAKMVRTNTSTLRHWENEFYWTKAARDRFNKRKYTTDALAKVITIGLLAKVGGMTADGIRKAHTMGYIAELSALFTDRQRNFRPEIFDTFDFKKYPYTYEESFEKEATHA